MAQSNDYDDDDAPRPRRRPRDEDDDFREHDTPRHKKSGGNGMLIAILAVVFVVCCGGGGTGAFLLFRGAKRAVNQAIENVQVVQESAESQQKMSKIGMAMHKYHDTVGFMPNNSYDVKGKQPKPLLSWRVHLLPYLGEEGLYKQFALDEAWDSPRNKALLAQMPAVYDGSSMRNKSGIGMTYFRGFSSKGAIFEKPVGNQPMRITLAGGIPDGTSNTIMFIEAGEPIEWTRPDDIDWSDGKPRPVLGGSPSWPFFNAVMCSGAVMQIRRELPDRTLKLLIDRQDGMPIPQGWDNQSK